MRAERLYDELAYGLDIVRALLTGMSSEEAAVKRDATSWSVLEVVCHLADEERDDFRRRVDLILHRPDDAWTPIDPEGWVVQRRYNARDLTESVIDLVAERQCSLAWLNGLKSPNWDAAYAAPFGRITAGDILSAWVAHDNLHTRQLLELRRSRVLALTAPYSIRYAGDW